MKKDILIASDIPGVEKRVAGKRNSAKNGNEKSTGNLQDIVRLNSFVEYKDRQSAQVNRIKIVLPDTADLRNKHISVFAPVSVALLGHRMGDVVDLETPNGSRKLEIITVTNVQK